MKSHSRITFFNLLASILGAAGASLMLGLPTLAQMPETSGTTSTPTEAPASTTESEGQKPSVIEKIPSSETPSTTEETETPSATEETETPSATEETETPSATEETDTPSASETEGSQKVPKIMKTTPVETPASEETAPTDSPDTGSMEVPSSDTDKPGTSDTTAPSGTTTPSGTTAPTEMPAGTTK